MLGIYIHIPFCVKKCGYCDFCSFAGQGGTRMSAYGEELCRRLMARARDCEGREIDTVYFGGGTPTLMSTESFGQIFKALYGHYRIREDCEITVECNPATADLQSLRALREMGVNRLSIGLQSAHEEELRRLGRAHGVKDFERTYEAARQAGFDNVSADLMYGIPEQTEGSFRQSLEYLCDLGPEHISAYGLKIEEGTAFYANRESLRLPSEEEEYRMYALCVSLLKRRGYEQYEISNFARKGRRSRHNLRYWQGEEYLGFGVAAHSYFSGVRFGYSRDLSAFLRGEEELSEQTEISEEERDREFLILGLRLSQGIALEEFAQRFGRPLNEVYPVVKERIRQGFLREEGGRISFTTKGFFVSNAILSELLEAVQEPKK